MLELRMIEDRCEGPTDAFQPVAQRACNTRDKPVHVMHFLNQSHGITRLPVVTFVADDDVPARFNRVVEQGNQRGVAEDEVIIVDQ